jgi:hypothetical protein
MVRNPIAYRRMHDATALAPFLCEADAQIKLLAD